MISQWTQADHPGPAFGTLTWQNCIIQYQASCTFSPLVFCFREILLHMHVYAHMCVCHTNMHICVHMCMHTSQGSGVTIEAAERQ